MGTVVNIVLSRMETRTRVVVAIREWALSRGLPVDGLIVRRVNPVSDERNRDKVSTAVAIEVCEVSPSADEVAENLRNSVPEIEHLIAALRKKDLVVC